DDIKLSKHIHELKPYITCVSREINQNYKNNENIIIEGTQGFGLSVYHSPYYPFATSRDTTASGFLSEVGVSPLRVSNIIMVLRTFPIRVGGNSGPLPNEIDWETIQVESGYPYKIQEFTSVTKRLRRVARFDIDIVERAISVNKPTEIALMGTDYLDYSNKNGKIFNELTPKTKSFVYWLEQQFNMKINFIGTGPMDEEIIDRIKNQEVVRSVQKIKKLKPYR
ncbi:MAG: adenylosuccinate synthetase, partial [Candidatus Hodarchaeota archaeon]